MEVDTIAAPAAWWAPTAIATDGQQLVVADATNHVVWRLGADGELRRLVGVGEAGDGDDAAPASAVALRAPAGVAIGGDGSLYVADTGNHVVRRVRPDGTTVRLPGPFRSPRWLAAGPDGSLLVVDDEGVHRIHTDGTVGTIPVALLGRPSSAVLDGAGTLYIADVELERIARVTPAGIASTVAGGTDALGALFELRGRPERPALHAPLRRPTSLSLDGTSGLLVVEDGRRSLRRILPDGTITTLAQLEPGTLVAGNYRGGVALLTAHEIACVSLAGVVLERRRVRRAPTSAGI